MDGNLALNGSSVVSGRIRLPRAGLWHADLHVQSQNPILGSVTIATADGKFSLVGTALPGSDVDDDSVRVRIVGGAGGMSNVIAPKFYGPVQARLPLQDVLSAAGEKLSPASASALLATQLTKWMRVGGTAAIAMMALVDKLSATYRAADDGTIWIGTDTFPDAGITADVLRLAPASGTMVIAGDQPALKPGTSFQGKRVQYVEHELGPGSLTTTLWYDRAA